MRNNRLPRFCRVVMTGILFFFLSCSVSDDKGGSGGGSLGSFVPVFKGTATYLDATFSDIIMYENQEDEDL